MAAATLTRSTRVVGIMLATMCLVCFANSPVVEEKLEIVKALFRTNEKFIQSEKAKFESERKSILEMADCNMAKLNFLRKLPNLSASELKDIENLTLTTDAYVRNRFRDMDKVVENLESKSEEMKAMIQYTELMTQMEPDSGVAYM